GASRSGLSDDDFRKKVVFDNPFVTKKSNDQKELEDFASKLYYEPTDTKSDESFVEFKERLKKLNSDCNGGNNYMFYLSTPPSLYDPIAKQLHAQGLHKQDDGWSRLVVEKPFGYNLKTAKDLNKKLQSYFTEEQIYRIDHYLGKETVQNLLVTRFSNAIYEPLWNRNYIHHVEITSAEDMGVGSRGGYYDGSGALRDMVQNHLLQLVALTAMEPPVQATADAIRTEKLKVFQSLRPYKPEDIHTHVIRGQYTGSKVKGEEVTGYRETEGVAEGSKTETYVALKFFIDNWRWAGVPFYIRSGKMLPTKVTEIVIHFKRSPHHIFIDEGNIENSTNQLIIRIQPNEGMLLKVGMKVPGEGFKVKSVNMDFHYSELTDAYVPEAYERLLLDCVQGDATLYARGDAVEAAWEFIDPILNAWKTDDSIKVFGYPAGTWGPEHADDLIKGERTWRYPCKNLTSDGEYCEL
ncbi:MAG: glucose-6-phosphate dehydrogenase, partial [Cyclobacteriaceae bacterium]